MSPRRITDSARKKSRMSRKSADSKEESAAGGPLDEEDNGPLKDGEKVFFEFDGVLVGVLTSEPLECLSAELSEHENENQMPCKSALEETEQPSRNLQVPLSPQKRASPLSPTLLENMQQLQEQTQVLLDVESLPPSSPSSSSKLNIIEGVPRDYDRKSRKRRRLVSDSKVQEETPTPQTSSDKIVESCHGETSQTKSSDKSSCGKISLPAAVFNILDDYKLTDSHFVEKDVYLKCLPKSKEELCTEVQYELDECDITWLKDINEQRSDYKLGLRDVEPEEMELLIDRLEKENYFEIQSSGVSQDTDEDAVCCICLDGESDNSNQIIFCDMCNIPVHQDCFGVPYIPEGSWLCRRCSICPNGGVSCIFCPNRDGAFKQTTDGRWAHVLCALWIPEVRFANPSLIEPVDDIDDIPAARWRLICFLCKQKGEGACIQCSLRSCVTAFHATCAQSAGLTLTVENLEANHNPPIRMTALCDKHTSDLDRKSSIAKVETVNKIYKEKQPSQCKPTFPTISLDRIATLCELVNFPGKYLFLKHLLPYWKLKRQMRGGAALLRNLDKMWNEDKYPPMPSPFIIEDKPGYNSKEANLLLLEKMCALKQELENFKHMYGLVKTRCELEKEEAEVKLEIYTLRVQRFDPVYLQILQKIEKKDRRGIFAEPVCEEDAPDYFSIINNPMDLSTMRTKVDNFQYASLEELEEDFQLMISNCMTYNKETTIFYKAAVKLMEYGNQIFQDVKLEQQRKKVLEAKSANNSRIDSENNIPKSDISEDTLETGEERAIKKVNAQNEKERQQKSLQRTLLNIFRRLDNHDKQGIFSEPVDVVEVTDYLTVIDKPMDFETMRNKIQNMQYSCIEDFEQDFILIVDNCMLYNEDSSYLYQIAFKLKEFGKPIFEKVKLKNKTPSQCSKSLAVPVHPNCDIEMKAESDNDLENLTPDSSHKPDVDNEKEEKHKVISEVLQKLIEHDEEGVFLEPVSLDLVSDYLEVIKTPMDFSEMRNKLQSGMYSSLNDLEEDFYLMINNCKEYNSKNSKFYKYAVSVKKAGDVIFRRSKEQSSVN